MFDFPLSSTVADEVILLRRALLQLLDALDESDVRTVDTRPLRLLLNRQNADSAPQAKPKKEA